ncbi:hypothetical protein ACFQKB_39565, partial [Actinomadura yumaensis]
MTTDDHPGPSGRDASRPDPAGFGPAIAHHAWRLSGRIVAGVGQLLLWILTGIGRLLRPLGVRLGAKLYGVGRASHAAGGPHGAPAGPGPHGAPAGP